MPQDVNASFYYELMEMSLHFRSASLKINSSRHGCMRYRTPSRLAASYMVLLPPPRAAHGSNL